MSEFNLTDLLRKPKEVYVVDVYPHALTLSDENLSYLYKPQQALTIKGSVLPILSPNEDYYQYSDFDKVHPLSLEDILKSNTDIVDRLGVLVMRGNFLKRNRRLLTTEADPYSIASQVAVSVALGTLDKVCPHFKPSPKLLDYKQYIHHLPQKQIIENTYEIALNDLCSGIIKFVNDDVWNIYFHKIKGSTLIIEKCIDYRIYKYYEMLNDKEIVNDAF